MSTGRPAGGPSLVHRYGAGADQVAELWLPAGSAPARGWPVAVLLHGGFWRALRTLELMRPMAADLAGRGVAAWNLEYRRVGDPGGGWPGTLEDVAAGVDALGGLAGRWGLDPGRTVAIGHSAGGQLALWTAARPGLPAGTPGAGPAVVVAAAVSLAGVCDLVAAARDDLGEGAAAGFLDASPEQAPDRYTLASPLARLPLGARQLLVHGDADDRVPIGQSRAYAAAAAAAGDPVELLELPGVDHLAVIDPAAPAWAATVARLGALLDGPHPPSRG